MHFGIASGTQNLEKNYQTQAGDKGNTLRASPLPMPVSSQSCNQDALTYTEFKKAVSQNQTTERKERIDTDAK